MYWETTLPCNHLVIWLWIEITWSWQSYSFWTVWLYVFGEIWLGHDACKFLFVLFKLPYGIDMISPCVSIYGIEETIKVKKTSLILFGIKEKKCIVKNIFILFIIVGLITTSWSPLITCSPFISTFIYLTRFHSVSTFNWFIPLVDVQAITTFINLHVCLTFNPCLVHTSWDPPINVTLVIFWILQVFRTCKDNFI